MLPYSPLHHLLLADAGVALVMTSGNVSDEPIAYRDDEALERLGSIADRFLVHDRPIETRTDDSVQRSVSVAGRRRALMLRRSRGYVPDSVELPIAAAAPVLACGAELKSTFCVAKGSRAWVGHHIGDLSNYETLVAFREGISHFERLFAVEPRVVAHDLHPGYLSTAYALEREGVEHVGVQHHHAHLAAALAEHGEQGPAIGAIYDGTGYGEDGTVWGGELLFGDLRGFERVGHLRPVRLPGGEQAIRQPWRMACAWLRRGARRAAGDPRHARHVRRAPPLGGGGGAGGHRHGVAAHDQHGTALRRGCGALRHALAGELRGAGGRPSWSLRRIRARPAPTRCRPTLDPREMVLGDRARHRRRRARRDSSRPVFTTRSPRRRRRRASRRPRAGASTSWSCPAACFRTGCCSSARRPHCDRGLRVLVPERLPPNDGGISYGQAAVAAARVTR